MTKLLVQCPLITWAKFNCHSRHQCHLWPHFTIYSSIVQYECKYVKYYDQYFQMHPKIMTPHLFECKKLTEGNMILKQNWSHMTQHILGKTLIWPQMVTCVTSAHNWPSTNFFPLWLNITKLLIQCPLMSCTKFHYHRHQWHPASHFMSHIALVKYKWK